MLAADSGKASIDNTPLLPNRPISNCLTPIKLFLGNRSFLVTLDNSNADGILLIMIKSFKCRDSEAMFNGKRIERFISIQSAAMRKLALLNVAGRIEDLRVPPGNRLEALKGKRQGQWSVRINDQWRICFRFEAGNAFDVEIVDYH